MKEGGTLFINGTYIWVVGGEQIWYHYSRDGRNDRILVEDKNNSTMYIDFE